ncbi:acetoacetate-CoA ligase [Protomyces lactucae-debilis]|uniref:Acetoacetate-CoA ligase n=1 Tax=Protomyces lactucae-debilis TaxID=2754530 RepID=A0A1Y2EW61_PROLT|nr:acetoacetate-CoA ligase [Protomyces lactucae-debilis]ORY75798.1 acetoacetate-CoA ligase [Protomyces lactucae-debilis]
MSDKLWSPGPEVVANANITHFIKQINKDRGLSLRTYEDLHKYSITKDVFWFDLFKFLKIIHSSPPTSVLENGQSLADAPLYPPPVFFPGCRLNYAENIIEGHDDQSLAIITALEGAKQIKRYTFGQVREIVHSYADALRASGVVKGDRVAGILCNSIHSACILLATTSIGAVYSSTATDMGTSGILDRLKQIRPKVILMDNAAHYNGKIFNLASKANEVLSVIDGDQLSRFVVVPNIADISCDLGHKKTVALTQWIKEAKRTPVLKYEQCAFTDPVFSMYSSGTTGPPKCIQHSVGGVVLSMKKEAVLQLDLHPGDVYYQFTTTNWMMYQVLITALSTGATILCLDGSPMVDIPKVLTFMDEIGVTLYGTSPRWLAEVRNLGIVPKDVAPFKRLRQVTSTGSALVTELYYHFYKAWPARVQLSSISGGTDLLSCIIAAVPILPIYAGELQSPCLGIAAASFDDEGKPLPIEHPGELVITRGFPSQPIYFLSDPDGKKYENAYYTHFPGIWRHGDFVQFKETGGAILLSRSDGVLNPSGVRFGSAEIYGITDKFPEIAEALCIGQRRPTDVDESVLLFLQMKDPRSFSQDLVQRIKKEIAKELSPRHVPRYVFMVKDIPMTINGKKVEIVVKQIVSGQTPKVSATVANPECLEEYKQYARIEEVVRQAKL